MLYGIPGTVLPCYGQTFLHCLIKVGLVGNVLAFFIIIIIHLNFIQNWCFVEINYYKILVDIRLDGNFSLEFRTL